MTIEKRQQHARILTELVRLALMQMERDEQPVSDEVKESARYHLEQALE